MPERRTAAAPRGPGWLREVPLAVLLGVLGFVSLPFLGDGQGPGRWEPPDGGPDGGHGGGPDGGPPFAPGWLDATPPDALAAVLVLTAAVSLVLRRRQPRWTLAVTTITSAAWLAIGYPFGPILLCLAVAVFAIARYRPTQEATLWAVGVVAVGLVAVLVGPRADTVLAVLVPLAAWVALPFTIGLARHLVSDARTRARADADERLVQHERLRLAHEVHDVVGHGLAAIQMQADIALHVRDSRPGQPEEALRAISAASAEALEELRSTLSSIRPDDAPSPGGSPDVRQGESRAATPGVARLPALAERVATAGVQVDLDVRVDGPLPAAADLAVYRIVQESLTNVVKHSAHPRAQVSVVREVDRVEVTVTNDDLHPEGHERGFGITGMQRRAAQLGGGLTFGPGGQPHTFRIHATLPVPPKESP